MAGNIRALRWSDNDRYFGPFTYARDTKGYRPLAVVLGSGDNDDYPHCRLRISGFGHTLLTRLPKIVRPWKQWVDTSRESWSSNPNDGFWDTGEREYGFSLSEGHLDVRLGRVTNDSSTEQRWGCFLPWTQWRHVRRSFYNADGSHFETLLEKPDWETQRFVADACPTTVFDFNDFDGERLTATTRIEEREWRFGEGWFKWLSLFRPAKIARSLDLRFSGETGKRKGSWKGGTIGTGIDMRRGETPEAAFRRYCGENNLTFVGKAAA